MYSTRIIPSSEPLRPRATLVRGGENYGGEKTSRAVLLRERKKKPTYGGKKKRFSAVKKEGGKKPPFRAI